MNYVYDSEVFPNCYLIWFKSENGMWAGFEISSRQSQVNELIEFMLRRKQSGDSLVGFNNVGFDYPVLHYVLNSRVSDPKAIYDFAMAMFASESKFPFMVRPSDCWAPQIDLFKIHHFDNKARMTSLKALEFNMRLPNISDLPFEPGTVLTSDQMDRLADYCRDDVMATELFYQQSKEKIAFRQQLSQRYKRDFTNYSDVKIGKEVFVISLEAAGVPCYEFGPDGRQPRQTPRAFINLADCVPPFVRFNSLEFERIRQHFLTTTVTQTKGAFDDLTAWFEGVEYKFGTGGLHASVENEQFRETADMMIYDVDVTSLYPSIAIENNLYPEHLGPVFVQVYRQLRQQRVSHKKGTAENAMLKLALNGVYGASNDPFSVFFDPLFTMRITISGQMMLAMLVEGLTRIAGNRIIQVNTDGITMYLPRTAKFLVDEVCRQWEQITRLSLESVEYDFMAIADVNSYVARGVDGKVKRKGRYEYDIEWHQDASALVVPKVAEKVLLEGADIEKTLKEWPDKMDFMLRLKANKGTQLIIEDGDRELLLDRTQRYYIAENGYPLFKIMPPLKANPTVSRKIAVQKGYKVAPCNNLERDDVGYTIDYRWYRNEVEKLVLGVL